MILLFNSLSIQQINRATTHAMLEVETCREPNEIPIFQLSEIDILTEEVEKRKEVLFSKQNSSVTNAAKKDKEKKLLQR
jgi:hypothetical protein